ncbi:unnamed protein product [Phaeothamnion confervicola]
MASLPPLLLFPSPHRSKKVSFVAEVQRGTKERGQIVAVLLGFRLALYVRRRSCHHRHCHWRASSFQQHPSSPAQRRWPETCSTSPSPQSRLQPATRWTAPLNRGRKRGARRRAAPQSRKQVVHRVKERRCCSHGVRQSAGPNRGAERSPGVRVVSLDGRSRARVSIMALESTLPVKSSAIRRLFRAPSIDWASSMRALLLRAEASLKKRHL